MLRNWRSFVLLFGLASAQAVAQDPNIPIFRVPTSDAQEPNTSTFPLPSSDDDQRFIERLKDTRVKQIERGLPNQSFDEWFSNLVKPQPVEYEIRESRDETTRDRTALWVVAYTPSSQPSGRRWVQVRFMVIRMKASKDARKRGEPKPFVLRFFDAWESPKFLQYPIPGYPIPVGPQMNPAYDQWATLNQLEESVRRSQGKKTPRKVPVL